MKIRINSFTSLFAFILILFCLFYSCKKEQPEVKPIGYLKFSVDPEFSNSLKSTDANEQLASIVISIDKADGTHVLSSKKISIQNTYDNYITEPIIIESGSYKLTYFAVLDASDQLIYLAPLSGSALAAYVKKPLSIDFTVLKDQTITLIPEVLSTTGTLPGDFGLTSFKFNIVKTINIFPYAFNPSTSSFELTDATLTISDGTTDLSTLLLNAKGNIIELPDKDNYTFKVQKMNYITFHCSFTKAEIESKNTPLIVMLKTELPGLVAYYPFEGNLNDISGYDRNGTYSGLSNFTIGDFGKARKFNTSSAPYDYIKVPNSINPNSFSVCFWMNLDSTEVHNTILFLSNGDQWAFSNLMLTTSSKKLGIIFDSLDLRTIDYSHDALIAGNFNSTFLNSMQFEKNVNTYICCTFSGNTVSVYFNGVLNAQYTGVNRTHETVTSNILIGVCPVEFSPGSYYYPLFGKLDELKIYNRALNSNEIKSLFNSYGGIIDIKSGLIAHYPLNANANDASGNGNNGTVYAATPAADRFGNANSAYYFNGVNSYITIPNSSSLQITGEMTMGAWINIKNKIIYSGIICKAGAIDATRQGYILGLSESGNTPRADLTYDRFTLAYGAVTSPTSLSNDTWYHISAVYTGTEISLFIDGKFIRKTYYNQGMQISTEPLLIGWDPNTWLSTRHFYGLIDDIRIYNRALSDNEIENLYISKE